MIWLYWNWCYFHAVLIITAWTNTYYVRTRVSLVRIFSVQAFLTVILLVFVFWNQAVTTQFAVFSTAIIENYWKAWYIRCSGIFPSYVKSNDRCHAFSRSFLTSFLTSLVELIVAAFRHSNKTLLSFLRHRIHAHDSVCTKVWANRS